MPIQLRTIFAFDPSLTPEQNIDLFINHLTADNSEFTQLLVSGLHILLPLPEQGPDRNAKRQQANAKIRTDLQNP